MSKITDWAATEEADLSTIATSLNNIATGVKTQNDLIIALEKQLADSGTVLSADDQAALDALKTHSTALVTQAAGIVVPTATPPPAT